MNTFFEKMKGRTTSPPGVSVSEICLSWLGSFLGIAIITLVNLQVSKGLDVIMMVSSFGASAGLVFGAIKSPLAQPRNLIGGHVLSALVGVASFQLCQGDVLLAAPLAVATSVAVMHATKTLHPPGGATALTAVIGGREIHSLGFLYALVPVGAGVAILLLVALIFNNLAKNRRYPEFWI